MALSERAPTLSRRAAVDELVGETEATRMVRRAAWLVGLVWLPVILIWSGMPFALTFDDAFSYAEIGRHLADGDGSTFDTLNVTNGYPPLWMSLTVPVYLLGLDGVAAIRVLLAMQLAMWVLTLWVVAGIVGRRLGGTPKAVVVLVGGVLALTGGNPFVLKMVVNGLESAPVVLVAVLLLDRLDRQQGKVLAGTQLTRLLTGALLGLAFLARADAALLLVCVGAWALVEARGQGAAARKALAEVLVLPALTVFAYGAINLAWFGHLTQVSGDVNRAAVTPGPAVLLLLAGAGAVALMAFLGRDRDPEAEPKFWRVAGFCAHTAWYPAFLMLLLGYHLILSTHLWLWHFAPMGLYATALLVLVAADLADGARLETPDQASHRSVLPIAAILGVPLVLAFAIQLRSFADPHVRSPQVASRDAGTWISDNLPADAVLGSWDAGVVGYFTEQPVIDLDGAVSSFDQLEASREGTQGAFLRDRGLSYLVMHGSLVDGEDPDIREAADELLGAVASDGLQQVHREEFTATTGPRAVFVYQLPD